MKNKFIKFSIIIFFIICIFISYLSFFGIKTDKFNNLITEKIEKNENLKIKLNDVFFKFDLANFEFNLSTSNTNIKYFNDEIKLSSAKATVSLNNFISRNFLIKKIVIESKQNEIKKITNIIKSHHQNLHTVLLNKIVNNGKVKFIAKINFNEDGKINDDFLISGEIIDLDINSFSKNSLIANLLFKIEKNKFIFQKFNIKYGDNKIKSDQINVLNVENDTYNISGDFVGENINIEPDVLNKLYPNIFKFLIKQKFVINSKGNFSFDINNKFKFSNISINNNINLNKLDYEVNNNQIKELFNIDKKINLINHNIQISFKGDPNKKLEKNYLNIDGEGNIFFDNKEDYITYSYNNQKQINNIKLKLDLKKNEVIINILNFIKPKNEKSELNINFSFKDLNNIIFKDIAFIHKENKFNIKDLELINKKIKGLRILNFKYVNLSKNVIDINLIKKNKDYKIYGKSFDGSKILDKILEGNDSKNLIYNLNSKIYIDIEKFFIDPKNYVKIKNGQIKYNKNEIENLSISSIFPNNKELFINIFLRNDEKVTIITSDYPRPIIKRYKFIKGFEEGFLNFKSIKKKEISKSILVIDNFKVKEMPVLARLLTLASLQGIADIMTGEGIRFTDFEMKFSKEKNVMNIEEIYAIGPAISVLMNGYIVDNELVSLRGTLVPATTINRSISSIPILGDILVGKKVGEGVFGVSFKIKGPPKELKTTVNPIKTLTPRFITRTLEKIKGN